MWFALDLCISYASVTTMVEFISTLKAKVLSEGSGEEPRFSERHKNEAIIEPWKERK